MIGCLLQAFGARADSTWVEPYRAPDLPVWTVEDVVAHALARRAESIEGQTTTTRALIQAEIATRTQWASPRLSAGFTRIGPEETARIGVSQRFDVSGWRSAVDATGAHREAAARQAMRLTLLETEIATRRAFHAVRHGQEQVRILDGWIARLAAGAAIIEARADRGDAARFDVLRLARAQRLAALRRATAAARLADAWASLQSLGEWPTPPTLTGTIAPLPRDPDAKRSLPRVKAADLRAAVLKAELKAWSGAGWRDWQIGASYLDGRREGARARGFQVSLTVPLALSDPDAATRAAVDARLRRTFVESAWLSRAAHAMAYAAFARMDQAVAALDAHPLTAEDAELTRLTELAFKGGEASLIELLDAYESDAALRLAHLDLQYEARKAAIALRRWPIKEAP